MRDPVPSSYVQCLLPQLVAALIVTTSAVSQTPPSQSSTTTPTYDQVWTQALAAQQQSSIGNAMIGFSPVILTIPGQPFTAQRVYTQWDPNGDPNQPDVTTTVTIARDTQGRIHYESSLTPGIVEVIVSDPIAQLSFRYVSGQPASVQLVASNCTQQTATSASASQPPATNALAATPPPIPASPTPTQQDLGTQTMQGALAYGQQQTRYLTGPSGLVTIQTVKWFAPTLGLNLLETSQYTGQANHTITTQQLQLGDPDPSLFTLPSGFTLPTPATNCGPQLTASQPNNLE